MLAINTSICRLCLTNENVIINIFDAYYDFIYKKIQVCLPISVSENDFLPKCICEACHARVISFYEFWNQTRQAEMHFMSLLVTNNKCIPQSSYFSSQQDYGTVSENFDTAAVPSCVELDSKPDHMNEPFLKEIKQEVEPCNSFYDESDNNQTNESELKMPMQTSSLDSPKIELDLKEEKVVKEEMEYSCDKCHFITSSKSTFNMHLKRHVRRYNMFCQECNISFLNKAQMTSHNIVKHNALPFQCAHCNEVFTSKNTLCNHIRSHDKSNVHVCEVCGKTYQKRYSYNRHVKRNHLGLSAKAQCAVCDRVLSSKEHLRRHMLVHTDERNWVCATCGKSYRSKCYLTEHSRIHAGIKPHKCEICGKCFTQRGSLTVHKRSHTGERPYECNYCGRSFIISTLMRYHMKKCSLAPIGLTSTEDEIKPQMVRSG